MKETKAMIVGDSAVAVRYLQKNLDQMGYAITSVASSREQAIEIANEESPDIVLMNIVLGDGMDGIKAAEIIYSKFNIPVIFFTVNEDETIFERTKEIESFGYIFIPFKDKELKRTIDVALYKHDVEQEQARQVQELRAGHKNVEEQLKNSYDELRTLQEASVHIMKDLETEIEERKQAEKELQSLRKSLEQRVKERTEELESSNEELQKEITERKQIEENLKKSEEKYRRLIEGLQDNFFFYSHNAEGVFTYLSPSITNVLGYSPEEFHTHYSEYMTDSPGNKKVEKYTSLSLEGIKQPPYEVEIYHKNGPIRMLKVQEAPVFDSSGKVIAVEGFAEDITERKRMEEELKMAVKTGEVKES